MGGRRVAVAHHDRPGRLVHGSVRHDGHRTLTSAEASRRHGRRDVRRPRLSHQPLGLRVHRRRSCGCTDDEPGLEASWDHRHRRDCCPVRPVPRTRRGRAVRLPAHPFVHRYPEQRADRPRLVHLARARLATTVAHQFRHAARGWIRRPGPGEGWLDRPVPTNSRPGSPSAGRRRRAHTGDDATGVRGQRRREDDRDPRASLGHRRRPRNRRSAQAVVSATL